MVAAGQCQLARLTTAQGFLSETLSKYVKHLSKTLPECLSVVYLCNSGSEANDLAIRRVFLFVSVRSMEIVVFP